VKKVSISLLLTTSTANLQRGLRVKEGDLKNQPFPLNSYPK